jgi:hypothetical protein
VGSKIHTQTKKANNNKVKKVTFIILVLTQIPNWFHVDLLQGHFYSVCGNNFWLLGTTFTILGDGRPITASVNSADGGYYSYSLYDVIMYLSFANQTKI